MGRVRAESQAQDASQDERISNLEGQQQQAPAPAAAPSRGVSADAVERLTQLGKLHEQGVLTDEEFAQEKQKVLSA